MSVWSRNVRMWRDINNNVSAYWSGDRGALQYTICIRTTGTIENSMLCVRACVQRICEKLDFRFGFFKWFTKTGCIHFKYWLCHQAIVHRSENRADLSSNPWRPFRVVWRFFLHGFAQSRAGIGLSVECWVLSGDHFDYTVCFLAPLQRIVVWLQIMIGHSGIRIQNSIADVNYSNS